MPRAKNFDNCIIYKLVCLDTTFPEVYVGSTTCFKQRKYDHKNKCYNEKHRSYNYKVYQHIREHGGFENFAMVEIEKYPCEDGRQLEAREEHWRKELKATLNGNRAFTTDEEKRIQVSKCGANFRNKNPTYMKEYCEANKERVRKQKHDYYIRKKLENLNLNKEIPETNII